MHTTVQFMLFIRRKHWCVNKGNKAAFPKTWRTMLILNFKTPNKSPIFNEAEVCNIKYHIGSQTVTVPQGLPTAECYLSFHAHPLHLSFFLAHIHAIQMDHQFQTHANIIKNSLHDVWGKQR